jgi:hypothetical protein
LLLFYANQQFLSKLKFSIDHPAFLGYIKSTKHIRNGTDIQAARALNRTVDSRSFLIHSAAGDDSGKGAVSNRYALFLFIQGFGAASPIV